MTIAGMQFRDVVAAIGLISVALAVYSYFTLHKVKLHHAVRVESKQRGVWLLIARLVNNGRSPIYIDKVELAQRKPLMDFGVEAFLSIPMVPDIDPQKEKNQPLAVGEGREYILIRRPHMGNLMKDIRNSELNDYWISVYTPKGEALKIKDILFFKSLKEYSQALPSDIMPEDTRAES